LTAPASIEVLKDSVGIETPDAAPLISDEPVE